ncbi:hypothetical protein CJ483_20595 [Bacillus sp. PK3_68]|nr:hypothetical protein CJ483_20595 [Bacillus sp. PK3_68]
MRLKDATSPFRLMLIGAVQSAPLFLLSSSWRLRVRRFHSLCQSLKKQLLVKSSNPLSRRTSAFCFSLIQLLALARTQISLSLSEFEKATPRQELQSAIAQDKRLLLFSYPAPAASPYGGFGLSIGV